MKTEISNEKSTIDKKTTFFKRLRKKFKAILKLLGILLVFIMGIIIGNKLILKAEPSIVDNSIINVTPDIDVTYFNTAF